MFLDIQKKMQLAFKTFLYSYDRNDDITYIIVVLAGRRQPAARFHTVFITVRREKRRNFHRSRPFSFEIFFSRRLSDRRDEKHAFRTTRTQ